MARPSVKEMRRKELTDAAIACVAKKGLQNTTITDVSESAGLSRGIINFYFATKEAMLESALESLLEGFFVRACKEAAKFEPQHAPWAFLSAHLSPDICNQKRMNVWLEYCGAAASHREYREALEAYAERWHETYRQLLKDANEAYAPKEAQRLFVTITGAWAQAGLGNLVQVRELAAELLQPSQAMPEKTQAPAKAAKKEKPAKEAKKTAKTKDKKKQAAKSKAEQLDLIDLFASKA